MINWLFLVTVTEDVSSPVEIQRTILTVGVPPTVNACVDAVRLASVIVPVSIAEDAK